MSSIVIYPGKYETAADFRDLLKYCDNTENKDSDKKVERLCFGVNPTSIETQFNTFERVRNIYQKNEGRKAYHFTVNVYRKNMEREKQIEAGTNIMYDLGNYIFHLGYQTNAYLHISPSVAIHVHFVMSNINFKTGERLPHEKAFFGKLKKHLKETNGLCKWEYVYFKK